MKIITLEEHCMNAAILAASKEASYKLSPGFQKAYSKGLPYSPSLEDAVNMGELRIAAMDAAGIDVQVLSTNPPGVQLLSGNEAISLAKVANDELAEAVKAHPNRFAAFATLPMSSPEAAAAELERAVNKLGFKGTMINGRTGDLFLDHPSFAPVLATAAKLDVPIYLHPTVPALAVQDAYYNGFNSDVTTRFSTTAWGWHAETGIHALRMILGGVFDKYPNLQIILGHWGEMIPYFLERVNESLPPEATKLDRTITEYFTNNAYVTPSGMFTLPPFMLAHQVMGADRIMYSVDYPYVSNNGAREFLEKAPISPADKEKIAHGNAERLLKL